MCVCVHAHMSVEDSPFSECQRIIFDIGSQEQVQLSFETGSLTYVHFVKQNIHACQTSLEFCPYLPL